MKITFVTRKFWNGYRNIHCDVVHITTKRVVCLTLDYNGVFAIKASWTQPFGVDLCVHVCFCVTAVTSSWNAELRNYVISRQIVIEHREVCRREYTI